MALRGDPSDRFDEAAVIGFGLFGNDVPAVSITPWKYENIAELKDALGFQEERYRARLRNLRCHVKTRTGSGLPLVSSGYMDEVSL